MRAVSVSASAVRHPSIGANPAQTNPSNNDSNATEKSHALESVQVTGQQQSPHAGSLVSDSASARSSTVSQEQVKWFKPGNYKIFLKLKPNIEMKMK